MQNWEAAARAGIGARFGQGFVRGAVCICAIAALHVGIARAESSGTLPSSIEGEALAPSSAEACVAPGVEPAPRSLSVVGARDVGCYVSTRTIPAATESISLVDVRPAAEFERFHIDGSTNIPLHAIKTKPFLRQKTIVLVGRGAVQLPLEEQCARLKADGYRVSVLSGGVKAWKENAGSFFGAVPDVLSLSTISASELYEATHTEKWLIVVSKAERPVAKHASVVAMTIDPANRVLAERNLQKLKALQTAKGARVVIANANGENYQPIEQLVRKAGLRDVWYLAGGTRSYADFIAQHNAMLERLDNPTRRRCNG